MATYSTVQSTFPKVAEQIINYNKNIVDILTNLSKISETQDTVISFTVADENGVSRSYTMPSLLGIQKELQRLDNNIKSLYSIDASGSLVRTEGSNAFKKIITVDLNREPQDIGVLTSVAKFKQSPNWFFDSLLNPLLSVEFDLTGIDDNVRKIQSRRYIVDFAKNSDGTLTTLGQSALNSFNDNFIGKATGAGDLSSFLNWHRTTPGVVEPNNPRYDEQIFDCEPNSVQFDGLFDVLKMDEDRINRKLFIVLNKLEYRDILSNSSRNLAIGDEVVVNTIGQNSKASTRYKIIEINTNSYGDGAGVRMERLDGFDPITTGIGTLKLYSPVIYSKKVRISIGYDERNVVFLKPVNADSNIVAKNWSRGTAFYTNDLLLEDSSDANGTSLQQFYIDYVYDYGTVLKDLVAKKIPNTLAGQPNIVTLNPDNFKVVQINQHLTDTPDANLIKQKHNIQLNLKSEIEQLQSAISDRGKKLKVSKFKSISEKKKFDIEIDDLQLKRESKAKQLATIAQEIINISNNPNSKVEPKFRLRGFWSIPESVATRGTKPQEIVQFRVQYKYVSKDGKETPVETFQVDSANNKASFSNWEEFKTDARKRVFDSTTGEYSWQMEDVADADTPNINQIDIPIQQNETVQFRVKAISEVGWPDSAVESEWSEILSIEFPDDLNNVYQENDINAILQSATKEELKVTMSNELTAKGLDEHLADQITVEGKVYLHDSESILSGFKDENGQSLDLYEYLQSLQNRIKSLEDRINRVKGELEVIVFRNNQEFAISNGSETVFNVECEDYLESFTAQGVPTGRVYENNIYVIKDFVVRIRNKSTSPLGLLSNRTYLQNSAVYNTAVPQCFWVNDKDELMTSDISGSTKTQINYQFVWSVNYDSVSDTTVTKLSENVGNAFTTNNSITGVLSSNEFNVGYNETNVLNFIGNNLSLLEPIKWIDNSTSVASTTKLLTTIHPVVQDLEKITETNSDKVKTINTGEQNDIIVPINIYFKLNALDTNQQGLNYQYVNLNNSTKTVKHIKKIKFFLENESENRPFTFSLKFNINRNKVIMKKITPALNTQIK
jgi:hypothetical protein